MTFPQVITVTAPNGSPSGNPGRAPAVVCVLAPVNRLEHDR
jgi:hypothetical protein